MGDDSMSSNTKLGKAEKGSKYWIQVLINSEQGKQFSDEIRKYDCSIGKIQWLSPLASDEYRELMTPNIPNACINMNIKPPFKKEDLDFYPWRGLHWDATGIEESGTLILVEAKAHLSETNDGGSGATHPKSIKTINTSMSDTFNYYKRGGEYPEEIWFKKHFQLGNRLTIVHKLNEKGISTKLVLLNIVNDGTHIKTTAEEWNDHYKMLFTEMFGELIVPDNVILINYDVQNMK